MSIYTAACFSLLAAPCNDSANDISHPQVQPYTQLHAENCPGESEAAEAPARGDSSLGGLSIDIRGKEGRINDGTNDCETDLLYACEDGLIGRGNGNGMDYNGGGDDEPGVNLLRS